MPNMSVPVDGRPQFDPSTVMIANAMMGRWPLTSGVEAVVPGGAYILKGTYPPSRPSGPSGGGGFSGLAASQATPEAPKSSAAARSLWPNLR
jgi:hypothetical protein